jgi:F-type H+/Na+-transporting ATPase subunit alpha
MRWLGDARRHVRATPLAPVAEQVGRVERIADGIALVSGLPGVRLGELVRFERGQVGFATTLDRNSLSCVLLDDLDTVEAGNLVRGTGEVTRVPVGPMLLGRVLDPLGRPLDGGNALNVERHEPIERSAPAIIDRDFVSEPVQTGLLVVDAMFALGRGQRELIIGDRATGKTAIAVDCIINQKTSDMICVYVAIRPEVVDSQAGDWSNSGPRRARALHLRHRKRFLLPACNGLRLLPASPWRNIFATAASMT